MKTAIPTWKRSPPLSQQPPFKNWDSVKLPLFENLGVGSTPPAESGGRILWGTGLILSNYICIFLKITNIYYGTIMRRELHVTKSLVYMRSSPCRWLVAENAKIFLSYNIFEISRAYYKTRNSGTRIYGTRNTGGTLAEHRNTGETTEHWRNNRNTTQ